MQDKGLPNSSGEEKLSELGSDENRRLSLDIRLVPTALTAWAVTAIALFALKIAIALAISALGVLLALYFVQRLWWQAPPRILVWLDTTLAYVVLPFASMIAAVIGVAARRKMVEAHELSKSLDGVTRVQMTLAQAPRASEHGAIAQAQVPEMPGNVIVFGGHELLSFDKATVLEAAVVVRAAARPGISGLRLTVRGTPDVVAEPSGTVARVREGLHDVSAALWHGADRLVPAMSLGDERRFTPHDHTMMVDSGLSHLSAVSGSNVALLVGAVLLALSWASPMMRAIAAGVSLFSFIAVVGTEPSVLRAVLTGAVGILAIAIGRRGQPIPTLASGVLVLVLLIPDLSVSVGFTLSVVATAALVLLAEPLAKRLATVPLVTRCPAPVVRTLSVALVAHTATMPVLAVLVGSYTHVGLVANLVVAPAVAPVTVLGTLAAACLAIGFTPGAYVLAWGAAPFAWWVYAVGERLSGVAREAGLIAHAEAPGAVTFQGKDATPTPEFLLPVGIVILLFLILWVWPKVVLATTGVIALVGLNIAAVTWAFALHIPRAPQNWTIATCAVKGEILVLARALESSKHLAQPSAASSQLDRRCRKSLSLNDVPFTVLSDPSFSAQNSAVVKKLQDSVVKHESRAEPAWYIVENCGQRARPSIRTPTGVPVVCPNRDGPQALYADGSVWRGSA